MLFTQRLFAIGNKPVTAFVRPLLLLPLILNLHALAPYGNQAEITMFTLAVF